ncbi:MAG: xanthine dehydrogenase molybdopterin binding subunit [Candidatus Zeuxoniibacter abyssi]|nr:MAG: xanthine dehydrogenase molybdopterin binding subunit [Candidatus Persebacteraceae bacterium AB1(2)]
MRTRTHPVGLAIPHNSAALHVSGEAIYIDDIPPPAGTLYAALGLSERAHAAFNMDLSPVGKAPGVVAVAAANDIIGENEIAPVFDGDPLFANGIVQYAGQSMFAVAAIDEKSARAAARLVRVRYQDKAAVLSVDEALRKKHFLIPEKDFSCIRRGNADKSTAAAAHQLRGEVRCGAQEHFYLEGQVALVVPQEDGDMLVFSSTQNPTEIQKLVGCVLGMAMHKVIVRTRRLGGGFGGKETQAALPACAAAILAKMSGRPVKLRLPRADDFVATGKRHPLLGRYHVGFDDNGRVRGAGFFLAADCGISADLSHAILRRAIFHVDNAYYYPNVNIVGAPCKTHKASNTAFRGFGGPQGMLVAEKMMDDIALHLSIDPLAVRRANFAQTGNKTPYGQTLCDCPLPAMTDDLAKRAGYQKKRLEVSAFNQKHTRIKRGLALTPVKFGISFTTTFLNQAGALIQVYHDGSIGLNHGGTEMGQGLFIKMTQVATAALGLPLSAVRNMETDTGKVPNTSATAASSGSDINGMAVLHAATKIRRRLTTVAADKFVCDKKDVIFANGRITGGGKKMTFAELVHTAYLNRVSLSATGYYRTPQIYFDKSTGAGKPFFYFAHGVAMSIVEINALSGENRLLSVDILHDVGDSINPAIDGGQIEGGFVQGWGWLLCEEIVWDKTGRLTHSGPATYKIPAAGDTPEHFTVHLWPKANTAQTIFRSKAAGEPPLMLAISAWRALAAAVAAGGGNPKALDAPATPERTLLALSTAK